MGSNGICGDLMGSFPLQVSSWFSLTRAVELGFLVLVAVDAHRLGRGVAGRRRRSSHCVQSDCQSVRCAGSGCMTVMWCQSMVGLSWCWVSEPISDPSLGPSLVSEPRAACGDPRSSRGSGLHTPEARECSGTIPEPRTAPEPRIRGIARIRVGSEARALAVYSDDAVSRA